MNSFCIGYTRERNQIDGHREITPICVRETPLRDRLFVNGIEFKRANFALLNLRGVLKILYKLLQVRCRKYKALMYNKNIIIISR